MVARALQPASSRSNLTNRGFGPLAQRSLRRTVRSVDLLPNSMTLRFITTLDLLPDAPVPTDFTGRVRRLCDTGQRVVAWYTDGVLHDPARGVPAYRLLRADGGVKYEMHYRNGVLSDPDPHTPAVRGYFADGQLHYEERYAMGWRNDGPAGEPALRKFRADGSVRHELRYHHGSRTDRHAV